MNKKNVIVPIVFLVICIICVMGFVLIKSGAGKTAPGDKEDKEEAEALSKYPEEVRDYVDAIKFFDSVDAENWKNMEDTSVKFTRDAFVQSIYYLGKIDIDKYSRNQEGIKRIKANIRDANEALEYLLKCENGEEGYDRYDGSVMLTEATDNMQVLKEETEKLKEKYKEYFD